MNGKNKTPGLTVLDTQQLDISLYNNPEEPVSTGLDQTMAGNMTFAHSSSTLPNDTFTRAELSTIVSTVGPLHQFNSQLSMSPRLPLGNIPPDLQPWLLYHIHRLTFHHYLLKSDSTNFFKTKFIDYTVGNEALLYAVASFSAFHWSVINKNGSCHMFLEFYNIAVQKLRKSIADGEYTMAMLITILQLASFEVST